MKIKRRGKRWRGFLYIGRQNGKAKYISKQGAKREVESWLASQKKDLDRGGFITPTKVTFGEFVERVRRDYLDTAVSAKTKERYLELLDCHVVPRLGAIPLSKIAPLHIQSMYADLLKTKSPRTVHHVHALTHRVLELAVKWQVLGRNIADSVEPPRVEKREVTIPSQADLVNLLARLEGSPLYVPAVLAYGAGLRRGEALALKWTDLDLSAGKLTVRESLEQTRSGLRFKPPKSQTSRRSLDLPAVVLDALRHHHRAQSEERLALGPAYAGNNLVNPHPHHPGAPWPPDAFSDTWAKTAEKVGFPDVTFHCLRHAHASILAATGVHPKVASLRLGHSGIGITLDLYSHLFDGMDRQAAERTEGILRQAIRRYRETRDLR